MSKRTNESILDQSLDREEHTPRRMNVAGVVLTLLGLAVVALVVVLT